MENNPFFDPSKLTDQQLLDRQLELQAKMAIVGRFGGSGESMLQSMIDAITAEQNERIYRLVFKLRQDATPDVIESDPDFRKQKEAEIENTPVHKPHRRQTVQKTSRPTTENNND